MHRFGPWFGGGRWLIPIASAALAILVAVGGDDGRLLLRYQRSAIEQGEFWRLLTGHFTHIGWSHLTMNLLALAGIWALVGQNLRALQWLFVYAVTVAGIDAGFWWWDPRLTWYVGLSGVLHGLLLAGLGAGWRTRPAEAVVVAALLVAKLAYEQRYGALPGSAETAGDDVVVNAHLYGALAGSLGLLLLRIRVSADASI
jgi:rhomboid family GlyGly-CTERM serine protease